MSSQQFPLHSYTIEEYVAFENGSVERHEFYRGAILAIAGRTRRHAGINGNVMAVLHGQLSGHPCSVLAVEMRLRVESANLTAYPDTLVACPPFNMSPADEIALTDARVIVEVLSDATAQFDRGLKFEAYSELPSFRHYLLVDQKRVCVEHRIRQADGSWKRVICTEMDDVIDLLAIECQLRLNEIYAEVVF